MSHSRNTAGTVPEPSENDNRIAVIDDEPRWLRVFDRLFRKSAYCLDTYTDPREFLKTVQDQPSRYCGVICDINMPHLNGYQVFEHLKSDKATADIPFLMVSGVLTQDYNYAKVQGISHLSKLDDHLSRKIFEELIEVIEQWPQLRDFMRSKQVSEDKIDFLHQFYINYHVVFNDILKYVNQMEEATNQSDPSAAESIRMACNQYMQRLQDTCMELIDTIQDYPQATGFVSKICVRCRTSLNMVMTFQLLLDEQPETGQEYGLLLDDCRESLEKIIAGSDSEYNLRSGDA